MAMRSLLENNLGMIIAFDGQGTVTFLNGLQERNWITGRERKRFLLKIFFQR